VNNKKEKAKHKNRIRKDNNIKQFALFFLQLVLFLSNSFLS